MPRRCSGFQGPTRGVGAGAGRIREGDNDKPLDEPPEAFRHSDGRSWGGLLFFKRRRTASPPWQETIRTFELVSLFSCLYTVSLLPMLQHASTWNSSPRNAPPPKIGKKVVFMAPEPLTLAATNLQERLPLKHKEMNPYDQSWCR